MANISKYEEANIHEFTKVIARHAFQFLNGRINKIVRARRIVFSKERAVDVGINNIIVASSAHGIIRVNVDFVLEINRFNKRRGIPPMSVETAILMIIGNIAHELSHCDQRNQVIAGDEQTNVFTTTELDPELIAEIANDVRTAMWLEAHEKEIQEEFNISIKMSTFRKNSLYLQINRKLGNPVDLHHWIPLKDSFEGFILSFGDLIGVKEIEKFIEYLKKKGIKNFSLVHTITQKEPIQYDFGDFEEIHKSKFLTDAMMDMLIDEIFIHTPIFVSYMEIEKDEATFYILKSRKKFKCNSYSDGIPDNVSRAFGSLSTLPKNTSKKVLKFFDDPMLLDISEMDDEIA